MKDSGWKVERHDSEPSNATRYRRICGTRVTSPDGRVMDWHGRMTKAEAIRQTKLYWEREAQIDAHAALMEATR